VSRLRLAEKYLAEVDWVYVSASTPVQREILQHYMVPPQKILHPTEDTYFEADEVLASSLSGPSPGACAWLRQRVLSAGPIPCRRRLYVSRKDSSSRRALNDSAIETYLSRLGFETICLNGCSFAQQKELFASAESVVGIHGGGLANLVFCQPGTKVVEILPAWYPNPTYLQLARACDLSHVFCLSVGERSEVETRGRDDFMVNLETLNAALRFLGIEEG
jgi:capsular polysaccharide biosynthesis protein